MSDIVTRLRGVKHNILADMTQEAADEIDRLRAELAAAKDELVSKADELAAAIKQRDEARELYCRQIAYDLFRTTGVFDPKEIAIKRGWVGLFKANEPAPREKEGGGA